MSDESEGNAASAQTPPEDDPKGQKMVIYMPQGAVIIERMDVEEHAQRVESTAQRAIRDEKTQPVQSAIVEPANGDEQQMLYRIARILDVITERTTVTEPAQPVSVTTQRAIGDEKTQPVQSATVEPANGDEQRILYRIVEKLDVITERMGAHQAIQPIGHIAADRDEDERDHMVDFVIRGPKEADTVHQPKSHHVDWTKERHVDWLHFVNFVFIIYVVLIAIIPAVLLTYFGTAVYAATSSSPRATIYRGDLMVSKLLPVSTLSVGDVVLLRDEHTWNLEVRQVQDITKLNNGDSTTLTTESDLGAVSRDSYTLNGATRIHKLTSVIPGIGDLSIVLTSIFVKIGMGLLLLVINVAVHIRKARRRRFNG